VAVVVGLAVTLGLVTPAGATRRRAVDPAARDPAVRRAVAFVRTQRATIDVPSLLIFDYEARRWGVRGLGDFRRLARAIPGATTSANAFVRLFGPQHHASRGALARTRDTDRITAYALECGATPLDRGYARRVRAAVGAGGYDATHALLALRWIGELGCRLPGAARLRASAIRRVIGELRSAGSVTDLSLEQAAFLEYAGARSSLPGGWVRRVRAAQRADGGWAENPAGTKLGDHDPTRSNWHATGLAVWVLLADRTRGVTATQMVPR
jgi:hypothetical protein